MRAASAVDTDASVMAGRIRNRHCSPVGMKKKAQVSGPRREVRSLAHSGQSFRLGTTANPYWRMKPSTNTGTAEAPAVTMVVTRSATE